MSTIGTTKTQRDQVTKKENIFDDTIELKTGQNLHRIIQGPQMTRTLFYPTIYEEEKEGNKETKTTYRAFNFIDIPPLIESIQEAESTSRSKAQDDGELGFKFQVRFWYLAIDLMDKTNSTVRPVRYPKSVKDDILDLETQTDIEDPNYLLNGLFFLYKILINKTVDPKKPRRYGTKYNASLYGENPWKGKIPISWLKADASEIIEELGGMEKLFTETEIEAINSCEINLAEVLKPQTEATMRETLQKHPINLLGRRANDHNLFYPQTKEFEEMIISLGLPVVKFDVTRKESRTEDSPKQKLKPVEVKPKKEPVDEPSQKATLGGLKLTTSTKLKTTQNTGDGEEW